MEVTGTCEYCRQTSIFQVTDTMMEDLPEAVKEYQEAETEIETTKAANLLATYNCHCKEGKVARNYFRRMRESQDKIEAMFRDDYPAIADILQEAKGLILAGDVRKITIQDAETGGTATMYIKKERLRIKWKRPVEMEIDAE